jgi:hypothetical protein
MLLWPLEVLLPTIVSITLIFFLVIVLAIILLDMVVEKLE